MTLTAKQIDHQAKIEAMPDPFVMDERFIAVMCTHVAVALDKCETNRITPYIEAFSEHPFGSVPAEILKAVKFEADRLIAGGRLKPKK